MSAGTVFVATGKHDLRGLARPPRANGLLGLKMYFALAPDQRAALHGRIELLLLSGGYAGLQLVEQERAVLCMLLPAAAYRRTGRNWDALLASLCAEAPWLERRLAGAIPCLPRPLAIAGTPYGHLYRAPRDAPGGLFRVGDQACVVPSFAGDGVAIALHSAVAATTTWLRGDGAAGYHARFVQQARTSLRFVLADSFRLPTASGTAGACRRLSRLAGNAGLRGRPQPRGAGRDRPQPLFRL